MRPPTSTLPAASSAGAAARSSTALDRWILQRLRRGMAAAPLAFALWDGFELPSLAGPPIGTIVVHDREALVRWIVNPELYFGEGYMRGAIEVRGDLVDVIVQAYRALPQDGFRRGHLGRRARANSVDDARDNVHRHYDLGNEFYRLWLDEQLVYTCAYFPEPGCTLEQAQHAKMDLVCRKLGLREGERVVEAGCGWGALALHMARHYGVRVQAFNLSTEQIAYARERARAEGLSDRVEFVEDDYRNVQGQFDVFVSVGMLEHVGLADYQAFGQVVDRVLTPDGRGFLHFIGRNRPQALNPWIRKRIFPGAYPPTLAEVFERILEPANLSVLDVENLRLHYARTLEEWLRRFDAASAAVERMFDASFVRAWRLYLAGSRAAFIAGYMQLFQIVFARGDTNRIPWTRYSGQPPAGGRPRG
jgi:cyclopropane-fatty-acyl-phospholipid synthase